MQYSTSKPVYEFHIHTKPFRHKSLPIQQKIRSQYIPKYWRKLKMDQKVIKPNEQDRLSKLTIKQIDRIIDMEKIKYVLSGKKSGHEELYLDKYVGGQNKHPNVYRANFLSKINKIAIQRGMITQQAQGYESIYGEYNPQSIRLRQLQKQKESIKYIKEYKVSKRQHRNMYSIHQIRKKQQFNRDDEKSVTYLQYEANVEDFQEKLKGSSCFQTYLKRNNSLRDEKKLLCNRKWFDGMSTFYLSEKQFLGTFSNQNTPYHMDLSSIIDNKCPRRRRNHMFNCNRVKTQPVQFSFNLQKTNFKTFSTQAWTPKS